MKNREKYKEDDEDRLNAFIKFCESSSLCGDCIIYNARCNTRGKTCMYHWLDLEAEEDENAKL